MGKLMWCLVGTLLLLAAPGSAQQREALLNLTGTITNWDALVAANIQGWSTTADDVCSWSFVTCSGSDVISLCIAGNTLPVSLQGSISESLVNLTALSQLTITSTQLGGPLASSWGGAQAFQNLTNLDLRGNMLTGSIPDTWLVPGAMPQLQNLYLDNNALSGTLSAEWAQEGNLANVNILSMSGNLLTGSLPYEWGAAGSSGGMSQLNIFNLARNQLQGPLPNWDQGGFQQLNSLDLSHNFLTGTLPAAWSGVMGLSRLQTLLLADNMLTGQAPAQWGLRNQFSGLQQLDLSGNLLTGAIMANWLTPGGWPALYNLTLNDNALTGSLPSQLGLPNVLPSLAILAARNTSLNGSLPASWVSNQPALATNNPLPLQFLDLGFNQGLTGVLPASWGLFPAAFQVISLPGCSLTGPLPGSWGNNSNWPAVIALELTGNCLTSTLPSQWAQDEYFDNLRVLLLGNNALTGSIPASWGSAPAMPVARLLDLSGNNLTGPVTGEWSHLLANSSIYVAPGNPGLCAPFPDPAFVGLASGCEPSVLQSCPSTSLQGLFSSCPTQTPQPSPSAPGPDAPLEGGASTMNATLILLGMDPNSFSPQLLQLTAQAVQQQLSFSDPVVEGTAYAPGILAGRRRLLQGPPRPSTAVDLTIGVTGQQQYNVVMADLAAMTRLGAGLLAQLQATGKFPGLQSVQLASAVIILPPHGPGGHGGNAGTVAASVLAPICFLLLGGGAGIWAVNKYRKRRRRQAVRLSSARTSDALTPGEKLEPFDSARVHEMLQLSRSVKGAEEVEASQLSGLAGADWLVAPEDIQLCHRPNGSLHLLGEGGFGTVYKASKGGITEVAVKVMGHAGTGGAARQAERLLQDQEAFKREILLLKSLRSSHVVQFLGACLQPGRLMLVTEYMAGGDLFTALAKDRSEPRKFSWSREPFSQEGAEPVRINGLNKRIALDLARGVAFLHSRNIVHFDVKSANCLLGRDGSAKLTDVGMAKIMRHKFLTTLQGQVGTFAWAAPEVLLGRECTEKVDVYSLGVVLWELSSGMQPAGRWLQPLRVGEDCNQAIKDLVMACLAEEPEQRPSALELIQMLSSL